MMSIGLLFSSVVIIVSLNLLAAFRQPMGNRQGLVAGRIAFKLMSTSSKNPVPTTVEGWKTILSPNQFAILRQAATEPAGYSERTPGELEFELKKQTGSKYPKEGQYTCVGCGTPLYEAKSKFDSGCGWPAYYEGLPNAIAEKPDADGRRIEIVCNNCGSHLGHVFKGEGFSTPTNERHCVNGVCLKYEPSV